MGGRRTRLAICSRPLSRHVLLLMQRVLLCPSKHGALTTKKSRGNTAQTSSWRPAFCFHVRAVVCLSSLIRPSYLENMKKNAEHAVASDKYRLEKKNNCETTNKHVHSCEHEFKQTIDDVLMTRRLSGVGSPAFSTLIYRNSVCLHFAPILPQDSVCSMLFTCFSHGL